MSSECDKKNNFIVYRITNLINGKTYIGLDTNNNPKYFGSGINIKKAILKYGKNNFTKEVVESNFDSIDKLREAEIKWIAYERANNPVGIYNIHSGGCVFADLCGKTWKELYGDSGSEHIKRKISDTLKKKGIKPPSRLGSSGSERQRAAVAITGKTRKRSQKEKDALAARTVRPIICLQNNIRYESLKDAAIVLGLSKGNICSVLKGTRKNTKGFTFKYVERI